MTSYRPQVRCFIPIRDGPRGCEDILDSMPATENLQLFGASGDQGVQVALPYELSNSKSSVASLTKFMILFQAGVVFFAISRHW